jgi:predicted nucleic acid-binding Zn ribbon protein
MEEYNFDAELQAALSKKQEWYNSESLQELLNEYRLMHTCVKNLYECFVKKSLIQPDPYRLDKKISEIIVPESSPFSESEIPKVFGARFSDYETMLDFICTYFRFSTENFSIQTVKKLLDLNKVFDWEDLSMNSSRMNTRALAMTINNAKTNSPNVVQSMINDSVAKCTQSSAVISKMLNELGVFLRELFKGGLRKDLFEHPDFDKAKAAESAEAEQAEIRRLYTKVTGKKTMYTDLIAEIVEEDHGPDKERKQAAVLDRLAIKGSSKVEKKKAAGPDTKEMIMQAILALGAMAPTLTQLHAKLGENFTLLYQKKNTFFNKLMAALRKAFHISEKERVCNLPIKDAKTGTERTQKINVNEFLTDLSRKERVYNGIGMKGVEYQKINASNEDAILSFVNKQISEVQSIFVIINALDAYFKNEVDTEFKVKVKGMQIELSALRNSIINANKKRGEYASFKEEHAQMQKLGLSDNV